MLTVDVSALKDVSKKFEDMADRAKSPKTAMDVIGAKAWKDVLNSFNVETDEDGSTWKPRAKERSGKRHKKGGSKLLRDTGRLRNSIRWASNQEEAKVFTTVDYAKFHEYGTKYIPIRSFMWINAKLRVKLLTDLLSYIKG